MLKIAFFETEEWEKPYLKKELKNHKLYFFNDAVNESNVNKIKDVDIISIFIYSKLDKSILSKFKNLKLIATRSTGFDHIDVKECTKRKIIVCTVPYYGENTVAEHAFALILSLTKNTQSMGTYKTPGFFAGRLAWS